MTVSITSLHPRDLHSVALIHVRAFPDSLLSQLDTRIVQQYYDWQLNGPHECISLGAILQGQLVGFLFGGRFNSALGGFLRKHKQEIILRSLRHPSLLTNPAFRQKMWLGIRLLFSVPKVASSQPQMSQQSFGILSIAVDPNYHRLGIGSLLMNEAEKIALQLHFDSMHLTVDIDNKDAIRFYEYLGWTRNIYEKKWNGIMSYELSQE